MKIARTLLRPIAFAAGMHAARQRRAFLAAHGRTREAQDRLLQELLQAHAATRFGRDHGFDRIRDYGDFRAAVPVRSYEQLRPYIQRVLQGETDALIPPGEPVLMFSLTSGTTGEPKHIPVTARFLADIRRGWNVFGLSALRDHPAAWLRPILQISSSMRESDSPRGLPCGAISGLLAATQKRIVRRMYAAPQCAAEIRDPAAKYYTILRCAVRRNVGLITTANPSSAIQLVETGRAHLERLLRDIADGTVRPPGEPHEDVVQRLRFRPDRKLARRIESAAGRDGALYPRHFWDPALLCLWTGGTVGLYLPRVRELFAGAAIRDVGLLASEGRFSIPLTDGTPAGVAEITSHFMEFIPAGQRNSKDPAVLRADELEVGGEYFLVVTNWAGLWRYDIDDRVRVTGRFGQSPIFEFLSRGLHTANITGEKITEHQVVEAMGRAAAEAGTQVRQFVLQGRFAQPPHYELRLERDTDGLGTRIAQCVDRHLGELNIEYRSKRESGRLGPVRFVSLPAGTLERTETENIRARRGRSEQYKHQYLLTEVLTEEP